MFASKHHPTAIVLDIDMPAGSGFSVAARLRAMAEFAFVPIIFITVSRRSDLRKLAAEYGATGFLVKPIDPAELLQLLCNEAAKSASSQ